MLQIATLIDDSGLKRKDLAEAANLSASALSRLIHEGHWPKKKDPDQIQAAIEKALHQAGVSNELLKTAWLPVPAESEAQTTEEVMTMLASKARLTQAAFKHFGISPRQERLLFPVDLELNELYPIAGISRSTEGGVVFENVADLIYDVIVDGGFLGVAGEVGSGKSSSLEHAIARVNDEGKQVTVIQPLGTILDQANDARRINASTIADAIVYQASKESPKRGKEAKMTQIKAILTSGVRAGQRFCLVLEHGDTLHGQTLKSLKRLWELKDGNKRLLSIVIVGQPELLETLARIGKTEAREVAIRLDMVEIMPLDVDHIIGYLDKKFMGIGKDLAQVFDDDAFQAIHAKLMMHDFCYPQALQNFVTRCMNWVADKGMAQGIERVEADVVEAVK